MKHTDSHLLINKQMLSIQDFAEAHAVSRTQAYREIGSGRLTASKVGKRTVITAENAANWRASLPVYRVAA